MQDEEFLEKLWQEFAEEEQSYDTNRESDEKF